MKVIIRADASVEIGTGHVMRCLALASYLRKMEAGISFICRELPGHMCGFIEDKGFSVHRLPEARRLPGDCGQVELYAQWLGVKLQREIEETTAVLTEETGVDWLIVDHYSLDKKWEVLMLPHVKKVMVIDDLASKPHDCDLLLNQNLYDGIEARYNGLLPGRCKKLLGPRYALLRPEFTEARKKMRLRDGRVRRILVFFGGSDPTNETLKALGAIRSLDIKEIAVDVVVGGANAHKKEIEEFCSAMPNVSFCCQTDDMAKLMSSADLAIGASGTAAWERCCLGLPAIVIIIAENQTETAVNLDRKGAVINLGRCKDTKEDDIKRELTDLIGNPQTVKAMSVESGKIADGSGIDIVLNELNPQRILSC